MADIASVAKAGVSSRLGEILRLAAFGVFALFTYALPVWADGCDWWNGICFGVNWKTATIEEIAGVDVNARADNGWTPLHWAASDNENPAVIEALLKAGTNPLLDSSVRGNDGPFPV